MAHRIELARSSRSSCQSCWQGIAKDEPRLAEEFVSSRTRTVACRFHHLECAADLRPLVLRSALGSCDLSLPQRGDLERRIAAALERERSRGGCRPPVREGRGDALEEVLLGRLAQDPDDAEALLVFADLLHGRGEPRGELIVLQHELRLSDDPGRRGQLLRRQTELLHCHAEALVPPVSLGDRIEWRDGFIRRLELCGRSGSRLGQAPELLAHPSLRLLDTLRVAFFIAPDGPAAVQALVARAPGTIRSLALGDSFEHILGPVPELLRRLPCLEQLALQGKTDLAALAHPTLSSLALSDLDWSYEGGAAAAVIRLDPGRLPGLRELRIGGSQDTDALCHALEGGGWLGHLSRLDLSGGTMTRRGAEALAGWTGRLAWLDVSGNRLTPSCRRLLEPRCDQLVFGGQQGEGQESWYVRHRRRPEWGRGRVVRELEGKLEIEFEGAGRKVLKADAPYLESM